MQKTPQLGGYDFLNPVLRSIQTCSLAMDIIGKSDLLSEYARITFGIILFSFAHLSNATTLFGP